MTNCSNCSDREKLQRLFNKTEPNSLFKLPLFSSFKIIFHRLMEGFLGSNALRIWQTSDKLGNKWWHAYDPVTGNYTSVNSEAAMRTWIEKRYYQ